MSDKEERMRTERDSMGEVQVPADAYYGAQTQRARDNFRISDRRFPRAMIRALGLIKGAAAHVNRELGLLDETIAEAVEQAAREVEKGELDEHFVLDVFQTGSGTSTNMNTNEVVANRATEILGGELGSRMVHPNDHVNMGQSSNDVIPTAIHVAVATTIEEILLPGLRRLHAALVAKAEEFDDVVKIGRTHLQDATPVRLGQEFSGWARQVELAVRRVDGCRASVGELALGGTAVGTGLNTDPSFAAGVIDRISDATGIDFREAENHFEAQGAQDALLETSGAVRTAAVSLMKVANDIRWLGSGPRCGLGELKLPAVQPGSSIMPGKVNPVIAESVVQVAAQVQGNDLTVGLGNQWGYFELNLMLPVMASNLLESVDILGRSAENLAVRCVEGIEADRDRIEAMIEQSLAMVTALAPVLGYDKAAAIAKESYETGRTVREIAREKQLVSEEELEEILDPRRMTEPGVPGR